jgi:site-specific DNA recombinase
MATSTTRAAIYCRISRDTEGTGAGVGRQEQDGRALCAANGWTVADVYVDNDVSAYSKKIRRQYLRMLDDLKAGHIDVVVCWHPDRLHRRPKELEEFIDIIEAAGATVATVVAGNYDLSTANGRMSARIVGAVARHESEQKSERIRRKLGQLREQGLPLGGQAGYGYTDKMTINDAEADQLRDAAARVLAGEPVTRIVAEWNAEGLTGSRGQPWTHNTLRQVLRSPRHAGLAVHEGAVTQAQWPAVFDRTTHERLIALFDDPKRRQARSDARLLTGMLRCGSCHPEPVTLHVRSGPGYGCRTCFRVVIGCDRVEALVVEQMFAAAVREQMGAVRTTANAAPLIAELDTVAQMRSRWARQAGRGEITEEEWSNARVELDARAAAAKDKLARMESLDPAAIVGPIADQWHGWTLGQQRMFLSRVVRSIVVDPARVKHWDPTRVHITWAWDEAEPTADTADHDVGAR